MVGFNIDSVSVSRSDSPATPQNEQGRTSLQSAPVGIVPLIRPRFDQAVWSNPDTQCRNSKAVWGPKVH